MKITVISDIHGELKYLQKAKDYLVNSDIVLLSGDITNFGGPDIASEIINELKVFNENIFAVHGNCDYPEVKTYLEKEEIGLHEKLKYFKGLNFTGIGGALAGPGHTPSTYFDEEYQTILDNISASGNELVLVTHAPPYKSKVDRAGHMLHAGSKSLRAFIEKRQPLACFSGHIHESRGIDYIGKTLLVNPGPFKAGYLTSAEYSDGKITAEIIEL